MSALFRRHSNLLCFYCRSPIAFPQDPHNFKCPSCQCWNRYDARGDIISDDPAMHLEHLNSDSFSKRGSHSRSQLPSVYRPAPFCLNCRTNQTLHINLLANYIPSPEDSEYRMRLGDVSAYNESLHQRYPFVCERCEPLVREEIEKKDHMARVQALGGSLSKGRARRRDIPGSLDKGRVKPKVQKLVWWRIRGVLWASAFAFSILGIWSAIYGRFPLRRFAYLSPLLPLVVVSSLFWAMWDSTYAAYQMARIQGRDVRVHYKGLYHVFHLATLCCRFVTSMLVAVHWWKPHLAIFQAAQPPLFERRATWYTTFLWLPLIVECTTVIVSCFIPRIHRPPSIRLVDTGSHKHSMTISRGATPDPLSRGTTPSLNLRPTPSLTEQDILTALSLSPHPAIPPTSGASNPIFGVSSLGVTKAKCPPRTRTPPLPEEREEDEMDWTPTVPQTSSAFGKQLADDGSWLRPQRFFAPEKPTGLENLLAGTKLQDDARPIGHQRGTSTDTWGVYVYAASIGGLVVALLSVLVYQFMLSKPATPLSTGSSAS